MCFDYGFGPLGMGLRLWKTRRFTKQMILLAPFFENAWQNRPN
jgi:hypothetical protein